MNEVRTITLFFAPEGLEFVKSRLLFCTVLVPIKLNLSLHRVREKNPGAPKVHTAEHCNGQTVPPHVEGETTPKEVSIV